MNEYELTYRSFEQNQNGIYYLKNIDLKAVLVISFNRSFILSPGKFSVQDKYIHYCRYYFLQYNVSS